MRIIPIIQAFLELSVLLFFYGVYVDNSTIWIIAGILMSIDDILGVMSGALNPISTIIITLIVSSFIKPWYLALFWVQAVFGILGIPGAFKKLFMKPNAMDKVHADLMSRIK